MSTFITMIMNAMMTVTTMTMMRMLTAMTMTMMMIMNSDDGDDEYKTNYFIVLELKQDKVVTMLFLGQKRRTFWVELLSSTLVAGYELEKGGGEVHF